MKISVQLESPDQPEIYPLLHALDQTLDSEYEGFCNHRMDVSGLLHPDVRFFVARDAAGAAVGIGAVRFNHAEQYGEVKRMYAVPEMRGQKVGEAILVRVLDTIRAQGYRTARLETGEKLTAAVGLYKKYGFARIPAWGEYVATADTSLCMQATI